LSRHIAENGDVMVRRAGALDAARHKFWARLGQPAWLDPATGGPRT